MLNPLSFNPNLILIGPLSIPLEAPQWCRRGLLSEVSKGMISSAIPVCIQDNKRLSVHLKVHSLPYDLDLRDLVNCLLTFMKTLTRDAVARNHPWMKPIPEAGITWMTCCRGLLGWSGVGGGKMAKGEENPLWATTVSKRELLLLWNTWAYYYVPGSAI